MTSNKWMLVAMVAAFLLPNVAQAQDAVFRTKGAGGSSKVNGKITKITPMSVTIDDREVKVSEIKRLSFGKEPSEINRAREQMESGRYSDSLEELKKITDAIRSPEIQAEVDFINAYSTSQISLRGGSVPAQTAGKAVRDFITKNPNSLHLYPAIEQYGKLLFAFGRPELAEAEFAKIANCDWLEYKVKGSFNRAQMLIQMGKTAEAEAAFDVILAVQSNDDIAQTYKLLAKTGKAKAQGLQGNTDAAKQSLDQLVKQENPDNKKLFANLYNALGAVHEKAGNTREATWSYMKTQLLYATEGEAHAEALYRLALLWPKLEDTDRANEARDTLKNRYRNSYWATKL